LLRFFQDKPLKDVATALGIKEDAARMRVTRAIGKLHSLLEKRGVAVSAAALGSIIATEAVTAAPAGLAASVAATAVASAATTGGTISTLLKIATVTKIKAGIIGAIVVAGVATPLVIQHQAQVKLTEKDSLLQQQSDQLAQLVSETQRLTNLLAQALSLTTFLSSFFPVQHDALHHVQ
jgi:hypothetical protein